MNSIFSSLEPVRLSSSPPSDGEFAMWSDALQAWTNTTAPAGSGDVTASGTLTSGSVIIGAGSAVVKATGDAAFPANASFVDTKGLTFAGGSGATTIIGDTRGADPSIVINNVAAGYAVVECPQYTDLFLDGGGSVTGVSGAAAYFDPGGSFQLIGPGNLAHLDINGAASDGLFAGTASITDLTGGDHYAFGIATNVNTSADATKSLWGALLTTTNSTAHDVLFGAAASFQWRNTGAGDLTTGVALEGLIEFGGSGAGGLLYASEGSLHHSGSGTISHGIGFYSEMTVTSTGAITTADAVFLQAPAISGGGSIGTFYYINAESLAGLTVDTAKGFINYGSLFVVDSTGVAKAAGYKSSDGTSGVTAGPFTTITGISVKNGLVVSLTGS
jgi:hypothetical protein